MKMKWNIVVAKNNTQRNILQQKTHLHQQKFDFSRTIYAEDLLFMA